MTASYAATRIALESAYQAGFDLAGVAPLSAPQDGARFEHWLDRGFHAGLAYLARDRSRILDPRGWLPGARSILVVGLAHSRVKVELPGGGRLARYAAGRDYHNLVTSRLRKLRRLLVERGVLGSPNRSRVGTDAIPLMERSHGAEAGLGFSSKAANLLHPRFGPWFFLGELVLDVELEPNHSPPSGSCGTCRACLDACPTGAIREPGLVDAGRCISYWTIEHRGSIPEEARAGIGPWAFGCDVCSEVCPWGKDAPDRAGQWGELEPARTALVDWLRPRAADRWAVWLRGSPLQRAGRERLARNAAVVLGNQPSAQGREVLLEALSFDPSALVREAAGGSLAAAHKSDAGVRAALERACAREVDQAARAALQRHRERL